LHHKRPSSPAGKLYPVKRRIHETFPSSDAGRSNAHEAVGNYIQEVLSHNQASFFRAVMTAERGAGRQMPDAGHAPDQKRLSLDPAATRWRTSPVASGHSSRILNTRANHDPMVGKPCRGRYTEKPDHSGPNRLPAWASQSQRVFSLAAVTGTPGSAPM